jgi:hypothetical protein
MVRATLWVANSSCDWQIEQPKAVSLPSVVSKVQPNNGSSTVQKPPSSLSYNYLQTSKFSPKR